MPMDPAQIDFTNIQLVLLDRDGVINVDSADYIKHPAEWRPIEGSIEAIVQLQQMVTVAVCTNQSGLGRGLFDESTLAAIHDKLNETIGAAGGKPLDIFYCPHLPDAGCPCRKPEPELLTTAMRAYNAVPANTLYAGDSEKDLLAADNAGCTGVLILTGNGELTSRTPRGQRVQLTCKNLLDLAHNMSAGFQVGANPSNP
jgi:D-glycero-D-manno-heptose 1,7-bisphosphate phosphatase